MTVAELKQMLEDYLRDNPHQAETEIMMEGCDCILTPKQIVFSKYNNCVLIEEGTYNETSSTQPRS